MDFSFFNKFVSKDAKQNTTSQNRSSLTKSDIDRLSQYGDQIAALYKQAKSDPMERIMLAAGMAGFSCHQAVKYQKWQFVVIGMDDGTKFYMGDAVNYYLLENPFSVASSLVAYYMYQTKSSTAPDVISIVRQGVNNLSDKNFLFLNRFHPSDVYKEVIDFWKEKYNNISAWCRTSEEWPVLFSKALQSTLNEINQPVEKLYNLAMECALYLSKMDDTSIRKNDVLLQRGEKLVYDFYENGIKVQLSSEDKLYIRNAIDTLKEFFKENKIAFSIQSISHDRLKIFEFQMLIRNVSVTVNIKVEMKPKLCSVIFCIPFKAKMDKIHNICMEICRMNYGHRTGSFQINPDNGEIINFASFQCLEGLKKDEFIMTFISNMNYISDNMENLKTFLC